MDRLVLPLAAAVMAAAGLGWLALHRAAPPPPALVALEPPARALPRPSPEVVVYVAGEVARPGVYRLGPGRRVDDAVRAAGAPKPTADLVAVNLAAPLRDGEEIVVPVRGAPPRLDPSVRARPRTARSGGRRARKRAVLPAAPLDLNAADLDALAGLPGLGRGLAERIVAFRRANGPFGSVDELADVAGLTERRLEQVLPYLTVRPEQGDAPGQVRRPRAPPE